MTPQDFISTFPQLKGGQQLLKFISSVPGGEEREGRRGKGEGRRGYQFHMSSLCFLNKKQPYFRFLIEKEHFQKDLLSLMMAELFLLCLKDCISPDTQTHLFPLDATFTYDLKRPREKDLGASMQALVLPFHLG